MILRPQADRLRIASFPFSMKTELIDKAAKIVKDPQLLVNIVSQRVTQLNAGYAPYVPTDSEMGAADIALTEIIQGKLVWRESEEQDEETPVSSFADGSDA